MVRASSSLAEERSRIENDNKYVTEKIALVTHYCSAMQKHAADLSGTARVLPVDTVTNVAEIGRKLQCHTYIVRKGIHTTLTSSAAANNSGQQMAECLSELSHSMQQQREDGLLGWLQRHW